MKTGEQGVAYYRDLEKLGKDAFEHIKLDFEQYAALDALEAVVGLARVGDVEIEWPRGTIRPVSEAEVVASNHRKGRYLQHPLLRHLLTEEPPVDGPRPEPSEPLLDETDVRQYIMAQLSWRLGMSAKEVTEGYIETPPVMKIPVRRSLRAGQADRRTRCTPTTSSTRRRHENDLFLQCRN